MVAERFNVHLVSLDPTEGAEMRKTRACVIISPDVVNKHLQTVLIAPLTTTRLGYPTRVSVVFGGKEGEIALDQMRAVDQRRLKKKLGKLRPPESSSVVATLLELFA